MNAHKYVCGRRAFTLLDLLVVLFVVALFASLILPALGRAKARARRIQCLGNLKQITLAFRIHADDCGQKFSWLVLPVDGGTADDIRQDACFHFRVLSNELNAPKLLLCPADRMKLPGETWPALTDANLSYFAGLEADELRPQSMLAGDRNVSGTYDNPIPCPALNSIWIGLGLLGVPLGSSIDANSAWTKDLHRGAGNVTLSDGSAHQLSSPGLQQQTIESDPFNNNNHARLPR